MRRMMKRSKDRKVFKNTAAVGRRINLGVSMYRGGIRL